MLQTTRSRLLQTTLAGLLMAVVTACSAIESEKILERHDRSQADLAQIRPIMRVASATRERGDLATAAGLYKRAHELTPERIEPLIHLGYTLNQAGASAEAAESFRRALRIEGENAEALRGLGLALMQRDQVDLAIEKFEAALDASEDVRVYNALGVAYDMNGDHGAAQTHYYAGLDLDPGSLSLRTNLGLSLALSGNFQDSIALLNEVSRDPMATPEHRQILALAYGLAGDTQAAARTARIDLDETSVKQYLRYYEQLRTQREAATASGS